MRLLLIGVVLVAAALLTACGDDDGDSSATSTTAASVTGQASQGPSATSLGSPTPTATPAVVIDGGITLGHPLVLAIAGNYVSQIPPVSLTDPPACEGINQKYEEASEEERTAIDEANIGRICILLSRSTFEDESATVFVGFYRSDAGETLNMELRDGAWIVSSVTTQEPIS